MNKFSGDVSYLGDQYWPIPLYVAATGFTAIVVQLFLIYRIFRVYVVLVLYLLIFTHVYFPTARAITLSVLLLLS